jgi:hypothetical protein
MNSALRKVGIIGSVAIAAGVTLAAFTSPPFDTAPTLTVPMVWQCYSGLVERTSAACYTSPVHPTNVIPARTHWYLVQCKATVQSMADSGIWTHPLLAGHFTNRINSTNILALAGLSSDFWTNTPPAGQSTATNGWHGLRRVITNLQWTVEHGFPSSCSASNVVASSSGAPCPDNTLTFTPASAPSDGFPLYEARNYFTGTNVTYQGTFEIYRRESGDCDNEFLDSSGSFAECYIPQNMTNGGPCELGFDVYRYVYTVTNTLTNYCASGFVCTPDFSEVCAHVAAIEFPSCAAPITNVIYDAVEWYNSSATGTCAVGATFNDPFGVGLKNGGWTNLFTSTSSATATLCRTTFATARVPWAGVETNLAWAIHDAVIVKKWRFNY